MQTRGTVRVTETWPTVSVEPDPEYTHQHLVTMVFAAELNEARRLLRYKGKTLADVVLEPRQESQP